MNTDAFTADARAAGYTEFYERDLNQALGPEPHTHDFDARLLVTGGSITLTMNGTTTTFQAGDTCEVPQGTVHAETVGPDGVKLLVAKRQA